MKLLFCLRPLGGFIGSFERVANPDYAILRCSAAPGIPGLLRKLLSIIQEFPQQELHHVEGFGAGGAVEAWLVERLRC
jgi:hypothetical protein